MPLFDKLFELFAVLTYVHLRAKQSDRLETEYSCSFHLWSIESFTPPEEAGVEPIAAGIISTLTAILQSSNVPKTDKEAMLQVIGEVAPNVSGFDTKDIARVRVALLGTVLRSLDDSIWSDNIHEIAGLTVFRDIMENIEQCGSLEFMFAGKSLHTQSMIAALTWLHCLSLAGWQAAEKVMVQTLLTKISHVTLCFVVDLMHCVGCSGEANDATIRRFLN